MADIDCSVQTCQKEIVGTVVILQDEEDVVDWTTDHGLGTYTGEDEQGDRTTWVMMHVTCFEDLLQEIYRAERMVAFNLMIAPVPVAREALGM